MPLPARRRSSAPVALSRALLAGARLVASSAACGALGAASAQTAAAPREPSREAVPRFVFAGGVDAEGHGPGSPYPPQLALHAAYQLFGGARGGESRLGARVGLDFTASDAGPTSSRLSFPVQTRRSRGLGVVLLGTYALTRGPVRPYVIGGAGVYRLRSTATYPSYAIPASGVREPDQTERVDEVHAGLSVGAGLSAPVGRVVLFGEARATVLPTAALSDTPGLRGVQLPLVLGLRF